MPSKRHLTKPLLDRLLAEKQVRALQAEQARRSLLGFIRFTKPDYVLSDFARRVCTALDQFLLAVREERRPVLVLQAPPQHGKSEIVSRRLPPYILGRCPNLRLAACSYSADLARDMNRDVQAIMMSDRYHQIYPDISLGKKRIVTSDGQPQRNSNRFDVPGHRGYYICAGVGGPLTGKSVDIGIIDDPIKNEQEARSPARKATIRKWYDMVFSTRLSRCSGQIIMATSWAIDDLAGTIQQTDPDVIHCKFPAIDAAGQALVPELHPLDKLRKVERMIGPTAWAAMYMQSPVKDGGNIFKTPWIQTWTYETLPPRFDEVIQSWDMAFKGTDGSDYVVGQVWGRAGPDYYLLDQVRDRMNFVGTLNSFASLTASWPEAMAKLIEDKANGPAVISFLKDKVSGLIPIEPDGSKIARAHAVTALWQAGNVYIPDISVAPWVAEFKSEIVQFPAGANDDQVDAMTQALRHLSRSEIGIWGRL